jgi:hypothetical protein
MTAALLTVLQSSAPRIASGAGDIRDIRGALVGPASTPWLQWTGLALGSVLLLAAIAWLLRRKGKREPSPFERAKTRIADAQASVGRLSSATLAASLFEAVRDHIAARWQLEAKHLTADELMSALTQRDEHRDLLRAYRPQLEELLGVCEHTKFSGAAPSRDLMVRLCASAREIVEGIERERHGGTA